MIDNKLLEKITNEINQLSSERYVLMGRTRALEPDFEITNYKFEMWQRIRDAYLASKEILDLSGLRLNNLPPEIGKLRNLEKLDLESCGIEEFPIEIGNLKNLKELNLRDNNLSFLPQQIGSLVSLEKLDLCFNTKIKELPTEFGKLVNLQELLISDNYFDENYLDKFLLTITNFKNLKLLEMVNIGITSMPPEIAKLNQLEDLDLHYNQLSDFPSEFSKLISLKNLDICGNNFSKLPDSIYELSNLESIYAGENRLEFIDPKVSQLKQLKFFYVGSIGKGLFFETENFEPTNQIKELPPSITELTNLNELDLSGNPISIPPEILEKTNNPFGIFSAYFSIVKEELEESIRKHEVERKRLWDELISFGIHRTPINEVKLLVVGQGSVGKTSIVQQILHGTFDQSQAKTEGISINRWQVEGSEKRETEGQSQSKIVNPKSEIRLNIWDFGGQEIMHATHQFFLTKRSLYLLVLDARMTQEENRVEYWLKIIQSFGGESPVLIVGNKTDQHPLDIDRTGLQKKYPNIVGILEISAATGAGIKALKVEIARQVDTLPHVRDLLPETWFTVKTKLEELGRDKNFITQDEYLNLCGANDVTDEISQHTLIGFLHDLGVVLHFQDDPRLEALGILNPQWVTNGVYKILNSHELFQNQGTLTLPILNKTLNPPEYPSNKRLFIVDMMKKFELCYDIEPDKSFLIPDLLSRGEPFTGDWDNALAFQYHYNVLPSSIITRFIVRMNILIYKNTIWRSGVVLKQGLNTARVIADYEDRTIDILVSGKNETRRDLLAMIRGEFDAIHKTIAKIEVTEKVPVPDVPEAEPVSLAFLQQLAIEGRDKLVVQAGNRLVDLIVKEVLGQIEKDEKSSPASSRMVVNIQNMYGAIGDNNTVNFIQQKFEPTYEAIESSARDATEKQDLTAEVDEIKDEVAKGEQANESFLSRRLRNLKKMAPDIAEVALATLANPAAGLGMVVQKVAKKIKDETR